MKQPNIVFLSSGHSPFSSRLFYKELRSLKKRYNILTIIAPYEKAKEITENINIIGIKKYRSRYNRLSTLSALYKKALKIHPNILHCHEPDSLLVCFLIKRKFPYVKVIYDCHEFHPYSFTENYPSTLRNPAKNLIEKYENSLASKIDAVIAVNQRLAKRFRNYNKSVIELPNYPSLDIIDNNVKKRELFSSSKVRLIYIGTLSTDRGLFKMLEVVKELKKHHPIELTLMGKFRSSGVKKRYSLKIEKYQISDSVKYLGHLSHKETVKNLGEADIGVFLLDKKERYMWGEPTKYFEYTASGLPVIITDLPAKRALIEKNKNGILVNPGSIDDVVKAVIFLINNKEEAKKMSENGMRAFYETYNWSKIESKLLNLYATLCNEDDIAS